MGDNVHPPLNSALISKVACRSGLISPSVAVVKAIPSTNENFLDIWGERPPEWGVLAAETQTQGQGQHGRSWVSPPNGNLYFTVGLPKMSGQGLSVLPLLAGLAVSEVFPKEGLKLKWPNDLLDQAERKVGGILVEGRALGSATYVIAGIGLNLSTAPKVEGERNTPGSLAVANRATQWNFVCGKIVGQLANIWREWGSRGAIPLLQRWEERAYKINKRIFLTVGGCIWEGKFHGIDEHGRLLLNQRGKILPFHKGDLHIA